MKAKLAVGALLVSMALVSQGFGVELLPGLRGLKGGPCCDPCGEPVKCCVPEPKACEPACNDPCCDPCCKPKHELLGGLKDLFKKKCCCDPCAAACEPVKCAVPEPKACDPCEPACCDPCCDRPLKRLLGKKCCCEACEPKACEKAACEPVCDPCNQCCKCRKRPVLRMLHALFGEKCCCDVCETGGCDQCGAAPAGAPVPAPKGAEPAPLPKAPKPDAEAQLNPPRSISQTSRHVARY